MKIGFIGCGKMGGALIKAFVRSGFSVEIASDVSEQNLKEAESLGVKTTRSNSDVEKAADVIFVAVKPNQIAGALREVDSESKKLFVSIAAGFSTASLEKILPKARVVRVMPNTPCMIGEAACVFSLGRRATKADADAISKFLCSVGLVFELREELLDAVTGLSGSGPAYFYLVAKALAEEGEKQGIPNEIALKLAAQTCVGAGKMILETGKSPDELISQVRSPGGTTEQGLKLLEQKQVELAFREAVAAATKKSKELGRK